MFQNHEIKKILRRYIECVVESIKEILFQFFANCVNDIILVLDKLAWLTVKQQVSQSNS